MLQITAEQRAVSCDGTQRNAVAQWGAPTQWGAATRRAPHPAAILAALAVAAVLSGCLGPPYRPEPREPGTSRPEGNATAPGSEPSQQAPQPAPTPSAPPKQFRLSPAAAALVNQARAQHAAGNSPVATATLERALRIEPDNPLLWIELARMNEADGNHAQADSMARKALQLAIGDPRAQASAWQLLADSLRARGRNQEASEADRRASGASGN